MHLQSSPTVLAGIGPKKAEELAEVDILTLEDLLHHVPFRYEDASQVTPIDQLEVGNLVTIEAEVLSARSFRTRNRMTMTQATVVDTDGSELTITFFNQPYVIKQLQSGKEYAFTGKVGEWKKQATLTNPHFELLEKEQRVHTGRVLPVYPQHKSISSVWLRRTLPTLLNQTNVLPTEYLPDHLLDSAALMSRPTAWKKIHTPDTIEEATQARRRIAFDELWNIFAALAEEQQRLQQLPARRTITRKKLDEFQAQFATALPFPLTPSQQTAIENLQAQFLQDRPFRQVVQGEVGSGKTLVAAFALMAMAAAGGQGLYIVPTTVLAEQHFASLRPIAEHLGFSIALWTGAKKGAPDADIVIGTHSFLHHTEKFSPDIIVIDEEHRFGVHQREYTWDEKRPPHLITMTATPIPRTLAHILYGEKEVSFLEPIPGKERNITTRVFPATKLQAHLEWLHDQVHEKNDQAFIITPLIEPSETEMFADTYDATTTYTRVTELFPDLRVGLLTGRTPTNEKQSLLEAMRSKKLDILVATPVIEVGIDIPDASIITILSAERFGFAQLHQLRGRVGRLGQKGWCFLMPSTGKASQRLRLLETTHNGHELAELDLQNRGAGEFLGTRQTGWDGLRVATWMDLSLIQHVKGLYQAHLTTPQESRDYT